MLQHRHPAQCSETSRHTSMYLYNSYCLLYPIGVWCLFCRVLLFALSLVQCPGRSSRNNLSPSAVQQPQISRNVFIDLGVEPLDNTAQLLENKNPVSAGEMLFSDASDPIPIPNRLLNRLLNSCLGSVNRCFGRPCIKALTCFFFFWDSRRLRPSSDLRFALASLVSEEADNLMDHLRHHTTLDKVVGLNPFVYSVLDKSTATSPFI